MQAITRGWVAQVTPVPERSSLKATRFCFKFYTVAQGRAGGAPLPSSLGLPAPAAGQLRCFAGSWGNQALVLVSPAHVFGAGERWHSQPASAQLGAATGTARHEAL